MSIIIVFGIFSFPQNIFSNFNKTDEPVSKAIEISVTKIETEKNNTYVPSYSHSFSSKYDDILKAENGAKEILETATNNGTISLDDYSSKNVTASYGRINIKNTTKEHLIDIKEYLNRNIPASIDKNGPVVLIYHTHSSESYQMIENSFYSNSLIADPNSLGVIRVGDALCDTIRSYGYEVIHDTTVYDTSFNGAFDRSREHISEILRANPSIQIVIDLHRDSISRKDGTKVKTTTEIDGKKVAQIQITAGCEESPVVSFPNWEKNLTFAIHLQEELAAYNQKIVRPILFCTRKYNLDLVPCAVNIDIGTDANTIREAVYSAEILGESIVKILKECESK